MASNMNAKLKAVAQVGDIKLLYKLIEEDPYVLEHIDSIPYVETPMHIAASVGHLQFVSELSRMKHSFAWKLNPQGFSPIHLAMQHGQEKIVLRMVDINKDLVRIKGREALTPLHIATQTGKLDFIAYFLSACPESIEDVTVRGETAFHIAVQNQQFEALEVLIGWLKRAHHQGSLGLEGRVLNWEDEVDNTVLHTSALMNDSKAVRLLVNTKVDLNARNSEKSTALDIAKSAEIKAILSGAGAKSSSSVTHDPTHADHLRSKITNLDKILFSILRIRMSITEEQRNACLVVAALVATVLFQSALSPPGGVYPPDAGDNNVNTTSLNSTTNASQKNAGKSVMAVVHFFILSNLNTHTLGVTIIVIYILNPSGIVGALLTFPVFCFFISYIYSLMVISPTFATLLFNCLMLGFYFCCFTVMYQALAVSYKRFRSHNKDREIRTKNGAVRNIW